ncbi:hypothetical protein RYX45_01375 [Alkalihalophilus pseudofirmus]|uniref:Uncharacterized protein n=1 Tax=Alkalihalophilus pseudofirmus TaxID=79885 RepID=A0AAJ2KXZ1_ALKPS|nr:hypothetical protein [Alkalihalophilus pseudofirmus]MDV2883813.1 hypothetical protein [Alkalihalophilus pseudofirmus]
MLEVNHKTGYSLVTDGIAIVGKIFYLPSGALLVKSLTDGYDTIAHSELEAVEIIRGRVHPC